jgi:glycosyltransferase involved in cell wall biosynthesis
MIKVHFTYQHVDTPWGGANNFIRAIKTELAHDYRFEYTDTVDAPCDIVFMNQLGKGPGGKGQRYKLAQVRRWKAEGRRIVVRAVNLNCHAFRMGLRNMTLGWLQDRQTIALLNLADFVIFQSAYQREFFLHAGYNGAQYRIIHNGASRFFWVDSPCAQTLDGHLRLVSSTASARATKRHDLIAKISLCDGVEVMHLGAWPEGLPSARVHLLGMQPRDEMLKTLVHAHFFLHPALNDPCPNAVFEALCAGLPVIYNSGIGSSSEIIGQCGLPLDESNLSNTVQQARSRYGELNNQVLQNRPRFAIDTAIVGYRDIFLQLSNIPLAR